MEFMLDFKQKTMDIKEFYIIDSKLLSSTVQAHPFGLKESTNNFSTEWNLILGNYSNVSFPIVFNKKYGQKLEDIIDTGWPSLYLISDKMKSILEKNNC